MGKIPCKKELIYILIFNLFVLCAFGNSVIATTEDNIETGNHGENITYTLNSETGVLTFDGAGIMDNENYEDEEVIVTSSIFGNKIVEAIINEGIRNIDAYTFKACTNLKNIQLPKSLIYVESSAFEGCTSLIKIVFPENVWEIGKNALKDCNSLNSITILNPECEIEVEGNAESIKKIKGYDDSTAEIFANENQIEFESLGKNPNSGTQYETGDITYLNADLYKVGDSEKYSIALVYKGKDKQQVYRYQIEIADDKDFSDLGSFHKVYLSKEGQCIIKKLNTGEKYYIRVRTNISNGATRVYGKWSEAITINVPGETETEDQEDSSDERPENVKWEIDENGTLYWSEGNVNEEGYSLEEEIPWYDQRDEIKNVVIGEGVDYISDYTFMDCENLEKITIPAEVTSVGSLAFWNCPNLKSMSVDESNPNYTCVNDVLFNKGKTELVKYPNAKEGKYTIPNTVRIIGEDAFRENNRLSGIVIPDSVDTIGVRAFYDCISLLNVTIPKSVTKMDDCGLGLIFHKGFDDKIEGFVMQGYVGTATEAYAWDNGLKFIGITDEVNNPTTQATKGNASTDKETTKPSDNKIKITAPSTAKINKVTKGKKKVSLKLKKISGAKGYMIQYGTKSNFKGAKTKYTTKIKVTIKKLTSKKKYYFRVKAYKLDGKKKVLSKKWSSVKKVKVK